MQYHYKYKESSKKREAYWIENSPIKDLLRKQSQGKIPLSKIEKDRLSKYAESQRKSKPKRKKK